MPGSPLHYLEREFYERIRSEPRLWSFLENGSLDGLWYWDLEHPEHEWMSPRFWEVLGYEPDEKAHRASEWQRLIFAEDLACARANLEAHLADPAHPYDQVVRYRHQNGSTVWVRCRGIAIRDATGRPIRMLGAHNDVTAIKQAEQELLALNADLEGRVAQRSRELQQLYREKLELQHQFHEAQRLESLAMMAAGVAHDFNNLLTIILGNAKLALDGEGRVQRRHIERIQSAGEHAARLTQQMLTSAGEGSAALVPTDVSDVVGGIQELLRASVRGRAQLEFRLATELPRIQADATQLRQMVVNLVTNAGEASVEAERRIRVTTGTLRADVASLAECIGPHRLLPGSYVFVEIRDHGKGLDTVDRARLFEPFFTTKLKGRGLGLAVVFGVVSAAGGAIHVAPTPGGGTTFTVLFPPKSSGESAERPTAAARTPGPASRPNP